MHTIRLKIEDSVFDKVIYLLKNLPKNDVQIIDEDKISSNLSFDDVQLFSNHAANTVEEWKDESEDAVWK